MPPPWERARSRSPRHRGKKGGQRHRRPKDWDRLEQEVREHRERQPQRANLVESQAQSSSRQERVERQAPSSRQERQERHQRQVDDEHIKRSKRLSRYLRHGTWHDDKTPRRDRYDVLPASGHVELDRLEKRLGISAHHIIFTAEQDQGDRFRWAEDYDTAPNKSVLPRDRLLRATRKLSQ